MMSFVRENRRTARYPVGVSVRVFLDSPLTGMRAEIVDMSAGGMRIRAPGLELSPNEQMTLRIARQDGRAAFATARIVRADHGGIAFRFEDLTSDDRELLAMPDFWTTADHINFT
jgi:hypothetical protein